MVPVIVEMDDRAFGLLEKGLQRLTDNHRP
jgi:hypothetical protein